MRNDGQGTDWTGDVIATLRQLWKEGHSTAEIGRRMGVSKNAIVGKAHRLDLPRRPFPIRQIGANTPRSVTRPKRTAAARLTGLMPLEAVTPPAIQPPVRPAIVPAPPPSRTVEHRPAATIGSKPCCWPIGEPGKAGFRFCDSLAVAHKPYCEQHCARAYMSPRPTSAQHGAEVGLR